MSRAAAAAAEISAEDVEVDVEESDERELLMKAFKDADTNGDGVVSKEELAVLLRNCTRLSDEQVEVVFNEFDADGDGKLNYEEFVEWLLAGDEATQPAKVWCLSLSSHQKARSAAFFGPFARLSTEDIEDTEKVWGLMREHADKKCEGKIGAALFTQFLHWTAVLAATMAGEAGAFDEAQREARRMVPRGGAVELSAADVRTLACDIIDIVVPEMGPELFRFLDHNGDGELQRGEWDAIVATVLNVVREDFDPSLLFKLAFAVIDKSGNKRLELEELVAFSTKIIKMMSRVGSVMLTTVAKAGSKSASHDAVNIAWATFDEDGDGTLTIEEVTHNYDPRALEFLACLSKVGTETLAHEGDGLQLIMAKAAFATVQELQAFGGDVRQSFMDLIRTTLSSKGRTIFEAVKKMDECQELVKSEAGRSLVGILESLLGGVDEGKFDESLRGFSDAMFDLLDTDQDGKVAASDVELFAQLVLSPTEDLETIKTRVQKLFAVFAGNEGTVTQEALFAFLAKLFAVAQHLLLFVLDLLSSFAAEGSGLLLRTAFDFYVRFRKDSAGVAIESFDLEEFVQFLTSAPQWSRLLVEEQLGAAGAGK